MFAKSLAAALVAAALLAIPAAAHRGGHAGFGGHMGFAPHAGFLHGPGGFHPGLRGPDFFARPGFVHRPFVGGVFVAPAYGAAYPYYYPYSYYPCPFPWYPYCYPYP